MEQSALFADAAPTTSKRHTHRGPNGKFRVHPGEIPADAEVATIWKAESIAGTFLNEYPNESKILRERARGQGVAFYDTMLKVDSDLAGFYRDLADDVLHYPRLVAPASDALQHVTHANFARFALSRIPSWQNFVRHAIDAYAQGFAVFEKMYEVLSGGEWAGAVCYSGLLDKPQKWFSFDRDRRLRLKSALNISPGELVDQNKFVVMTFGTNSNPWGEPTLDYVYFPWKLKHHGLKWWALWQEKWASPTAAGYYPWSSGGKMNEENRKKALSVLMAFQQDQAVAIPQGLDIKLIESLRNGTVSYDGYISTLTEMESRLVTGQILTSMGAEGGSHALGKVHEKRAANKVEMLAKWVSQNVNQFLIEELIDRNFGPQDVYPTFKILAKSPIARQAEATLEQQLIGNGHKLSRSYYDEVFDVVPPTDPADELMSPQNIKPGQVLPVSTQLAEPPPATPQRIELARHAELHQAVQAKAKAKKDRLDAVGRAAVAKAKPAIKQIVKSLAGTVRSKGKKGLSHVRQAHLYGAMKAAPGTAALGDALHTMLDRPSRMAFAAGDEQPPDISDAAKLALALQMLAIAERVNQAAQDAPEGMDAGALADSMTDPNGLAIDQAYGNLFEGTHSTNIASVATANLRRQLADPKFRKAHPYVMIVVTNPDARLSHRMMDGFILSAEEARYSPFLPPFAFGCDCQAIPISASQAVAMGLTGAQPAGSLQEFLQGRGATVSNRGGGYQTPDGQAFFPGPSPGFSPAYSGTDLQVQLEALRAKAEEIRAEDPQAWAELHSWLLWLFAYDILRKDPPPDEQPELDQSAA